MHQSISYKRTEVCFTDRPKQFPNFVGDFEYLLPVKFCHLYIPEIQGWDQVSMTNQRQM